MNYKSQESILVYILDFAEQAFFGGILCLQIDFFAHFWSLSIQDHYFAKLVVMKYNGEPSWLKS